MSNVSAFIADCAASLAADSVYLLPNETLRQLTLKHEITIEKAKRQLHEASERFYAEGWAIGLDPVTYGLEYRTRVGACNLWGAVVYMLSRPAGCDHITRVERPKDENAQCAVCCEANAEVFPCQDGLPRCRRCGGVA